MTVLSVDIETFSGVNITVGAHRYVADPLFEILLIAYAIGDEEPKLIDCTAGDNTEEFEALINDPKNLKTAFNSEFEKVCLRTRFPNMDLINWDCTALLARMMGYPKKLVQVAKALKLGEQKDKIGTRLIKYYCMPCKPTKIDGERIRNLPEHSKKATPKLGELNWKMFCEYCKQDVRTEREVRRALRPDLIETDLALLDFKISDKGIRIDLDLVQKAQKIVKELEAQGKKAFEKYEGDLSPTKNKKVLAWTKDHGGTLTALNKEHIAEHFDSQPPVVQEILELRALVGGKSSIAKYHTMLDRQVDGRLHGELISYGAHTGRYAGSGVQVQNLPRNYLPAIHIARELLRDGDIELIKMFYGPKLPVILSELLRTMIIPTEGSVFSMADYSSIECHVLAWLSQSEWKMDVFRNDGKIYEAVASRMFNVPVSSIHKGSDLRARGKLAELALGYGGSATTPGIIAGAKRAGIDESELVGIVKAWRDSNPDICGYKKGFWKSVERAAIKTVKTGAKSEYRGLKFFMNNSNLYIKILSGRHLSYPCAKIGKNKWGGDQVLHRGGQTFFETSKWGGSFTENIIQAISRDFLTAAMLRLDKAGYKIVFHVHDEVIIESEDLDNILKIMCVNPSWAKGIQLRADGFKNNFFMKG